MYGDWQKKEEEFHLEQTKERSKIRLLGNREKPIDLIAKNILLIDAAANVDKRDNDTEYTTAKNVSLLELDVEIRNPLSIVGELSTADLAALVDDISGYLQVRPIPGDVVVVAAAVVVVVVVVVVVHVIPLPLPLLYRYHTVTVPSLLAGAAGRARAVRRLLGGAAGGGGG